MLKNGKKTGNTYFSVYVFAGENKTRLFTANIAKKSVKKSSDRNRYKRWMRAVLRKHIDLFQGMDVMVMPRSGMAKLSDYASIEQALLPLFPKGKDGS